MQYAMHEIYNTVLYFTCPNIKIFSSSSCFVLFILHDPVYLSIKHQKPPTKFVVKAREECKWISKGVVVYLSQ